jgi:hypothetical protein
MREDLDEVSDSEGRVFPMTHLQPVRKNPEVTQLPVSIPILFRDCIATCTFFAQQLENEAVSGGDRLLRRWRVTAKTLSEPEPSSLKW